MQHPMLTEKDIEKFYQDVKKLGLKKPVSSIAKATDYGSPNVSEWLSKKKTPSEAFIRKFYEIFYKDSTPAGSFARMTNVDPPVTATDLPVEYQNRPDTILFNLSVSIKDYAEAALLREQNYKQMLAQVTANALAETPPAFDSILAGLQELIIDLGLGKNWQTRQEGRSAVSNKLYGKLPKKKVKGTQIG